MDSLNSKEFIDFLDFEYCLKPKQGNQIKSVILKSRVTFDQKIHFSPMPLRIPSTGAVSKVFLIGSWPRNDRSAELSKHPLHCRRQSVLLASRVCAHALALTLALNFGIGRKFAQMALARHSAGQPTGLLFSSSQTSGTASAHSKP